MLRAEIKEKRLRERFLLLYSLHADVSCGGPLTFSPKSSFLLRMHSGPKALGRQWKRDRNRRRMPTGYPSSFQALRLYTPPLFHSVFTRFILAFPFHIGGVGRPTQVSLKSHSVTLNTTLLYHVENSLILRTSEVARPNSLLYPRL